MGVGHTIAQHAEFLISKLALDMNDRMWPIADCLLLGGHRQ